MAGEKALSPAHITTSEGSVAEMLSLPQLPSLGNPVRLLAEFTGLLSTRTEKLGQPSGPGWGGASILDKAAVTAQGELASLRDTGNPVQNSSVLAKLQATEAVLQWIMLGSHKGSNVSGFRLG